MTLLLFVSDVKIQGKVQPYFKYCLGISKLIETPIVVIFIVALHRHFLYYIVILLLNMRNKSVVMVQAR